MSWIKWDEEDYRNWWWANYSWLKDYYILLPSTERTKAMWENNRPKDEGWVEVKQDKLVKVEPNRPNYNPPKPPFTLDIPALTPKQVIFCPPATIVYWMDNTRTVVKASEHDTFDEEKGFVMAYMKKLFHVSQNGDYYKFIKDWVYKKAIHKETKVK